MFYKKDFYKIFFFLLNINYQATINNIETLQYINNIKENIPIKVFVFFFKDTNFFENFKKTSPKDFLEIIKDLSYFYYLNENFLLLPPEKIELVGGQISQKILLHNCDALIGICIFVISFDGVYKKTMFIPGDKEINKNLLFIIESNNIIVKNGILSSFEINNIINKIKKS